MIINGLKINYRIIGEGRPFLILHGWGSNSKKWQKVGELLVGKGLKVIIPDLPGFGESQKPTISWNLDDYCSFVEEFVKFLNFEKFYLLGHSFGGALAVKFSLKFPEKIEKLFLVGAACFRKQTFRKKILYLISKIFRVFSFITFLRKAFYRFLVKSDYLSTEGVMKNSYLKIIKEDLSDILSLVQVPTLIICGDNDSITPVKDARLINKKIKNSRLEVLPKANHDVNSKCSDKLAETIIKFL